MSQRPSQINALTGIRALAALWVSLFHVQHIHPFYNPEIAWVTPFLMKGWLGVDLFFILSGFILSYVYFESLTNTSKFRFTEFYRRRLARVYPAHVFVLLLFLPVVFGAQYFIGYEPPSENFSLRSFLLSLTLLNGWGFPGSDGWNVPSWSISSEWWAYLWFPLLAPFILKVRSAGVSGLGILLIFSGMYILSFSLGNGQSYFLSSEFMLLRISSEFVVGMLIFSVFRALKASAKPKGELCDRMALFLLFLFPVLATPFESSIWDGVLIALFAIFILCLSLADGAVSRLLGGKTFVYLGKISYAYYLIHSLVLMCFNQVSQRLIPAECSLWIQSLVLVAYILVCFVGAALIFHFVEEPARRYLSGRRLPSSG